MCTHFSVCSSWSTPQQSFQCTWPSSQIRTLWRHSVTWAETAHGITIETVIETVAMATTTVKAADWPVSWDRRRQTSYRSCRCRTTVTCLKSPTWIRVGWRGFWASTTTRTSCRCSGLSTASCIRTAPCTMTLRMGIRPAPCRSRSNACASPCRDARRTFAYRASAHAGACASSCGRTDTAPWSSSGRTWGRSSGPAGYARGTVITGGRVRSPRGWAASWNSPQASPFSGGTAAEKATASGSMFRTPSLLSVPAPVKCFPLSPFTSLSKC